MIYLSLFWEFLKIGLFAFGGAYGAIPLIQDCVYSNGWMTEEMFANMLAISESTPGPIMVNAATYIGSSLAGILGAAVATFGVILPSFVIILMVSVFLRKWLRHNAVQNILTGIKPCLMGIILATGAFLLYSILAKNNAFDFTGLVIFIILTAVLVINRIVRKKPLSPILLIIISMLLGIVLY